MFYMSGSQFFLLLFHKRLIQEMSLKSLNLKVGMCVCSQGREFWHLIQ